MAAKVTYYFSMVSPWAYIGHDTFMGLVSQYELEVAYRPVALLDVFAETGGVPFSKRHPVRQAYRMVELQRWREKRGMEFNLQPKSWPFDASLADKVIIALSENSLDPAPFMALGFRAIWRQQQNLADEATVLEILDNAGNKGKAIIDLAKEDRTGALYKQYTEEAIGTGAFGSPVYMLNGEPFWGQDRLDLLEDALRTGREPFSAKVA